MGAGQCVYRTTLSDTNSITYRGIEMKDKLNSYLPSHYDQ